MISIRITSNPYERKIGYHKLIKGEWVEINETNNEYSNFLNEKFTEGYFPFRIGEIISEIQSEYDDGSGKTYIEFEGAEDEYAELESYCSDPELKTSVTIHKVGRTLNNARDVLESVIKLGFTMLDIAEGEETKENELIVENIRKFKETSSDSVPVFIIGNYSTGKSSFVNALIGNEILPSGDDSVTEKIFTIRMSEASDKARVSFSIANEQYSFDVSAESVCSDKYDEETGFVSNTIAEVEKLSDKGITTFLNCIIRCINDFEKDRDLNDRKMGTLIEISTPFMSKREGLEFLRKIVLYDTPGSNAALHINTSELLKQAVKDISNGLMIYIARSDSLSSMDNKGLCDEIIEMGTIDKRFIMLAANRADDADLPAGGFTDEKIKGIMNNNLPKQLRPYGLWYVSSIMGLASKVDGKLIDSHYYNVFRKNIENFSDKDSRGYTQLYRYDILPKQIKEAALKHAEDSGEDLVYINSGFMSLEDSIKEFVEKYAPYNKCAQIAGYFKEIIKGTSAEIKKRREKLEEDKAAAEQRLDEEKQKLLEMIKQQTELARNWNVTEYSKEIEKAKIEKYLEASASEFAELENHLDSIKRQEAEYSQMEGSVEAYKKSIGENLKNNLKDMKSVKELKAVGRSLLDDIKNAHASSKELKNIDKAIKDETADEVIAYANERFDRSIAMIIHSLLQESEIYWAQAQNSYQRMLTELIENEDYFEAEKKKSLVEEVNKQKIMLKRDSEISFIKADFKKYVIDVLGVKFIDTNTLNIPDLIKEYNEKVRRTINEVAGEICEREKDPFTEWAYSIVEVLRTNIEGYNPSLRNIVDEIRMDEEAISVLTEKEEKLKGYNDDLLKLITWGSEGEDGRSE